MRNRATHLAFGTLAAASFGIGSIATVSAITSSGDHEVSLSNANKAAAVAVLPTPAAPKKAPAPAVKKPAGPKVLLSGTTKGSYFWDTGDSGNGDTGAPASGLPMQEGCFASPSWPMGTKGYIEYKGKKHTFFICDRGPGVPSHSGVMLDIDGITYSKLTGGKWVKPEVVGGDGQEGHIAVKWYVTQWGSGSGTKGMPQPF